MMNLPRRTPWHLLLFPALATFAGCFDDTSAAPDAAGRDASKDVTNDQPTDLAPDVTDEAPKDAAPDGPDDAADDTTVRPDVAPDLADDVALDAPDDASDSVVVDTAPDVDAPGTCASDRDCVDMANPRCDTMRGVCVACLTDDACPVRSICADGQCVPGCNERRGCASGEACCANVCVDLNRDIANCGACGARCQAANGVPACAGGRCAVDSCTAGFANCNGAVTDGCEVNLSSDTLNCGDCGRACESVANADIACASGRCGSTCREGFGDCDGLGGNGCERNTQTDPAHCGRCGNACPMRAHATSAVCGAGICGFVCAAGYDNCDGDPANGCEADLNGDATHCGACDRACPGGAHAGGACAMGTCGLRCDAGWGDCDGDTSNGCETSLVTNGEHCGRCNNRCSVAGGTAACVAGACAVAACGADFADCDHDPSNGCEADLRTNAAHCSTCGFACASPPNAAGVCEGRTCVARCNTGFADCDMSAANGCEVDTRTSVSHCGTCGRACSVPNGTPACVAGSCAIGACAPGRGNCDGAVSNGCEATLNTDPANCGACGVRVAEVCDGVDNSCDGRVDEGCPTGLAGTDVYDFTSATFGAGSGTTYDLACPAGTFAVGISGRLYSGLYQSQWSFRCARPRVVEDRARTPYAYSIAWDAAGTAGPVGVASGTTFSFDCPAGSVLHRITPYVYLSIVSQVTWECASWSITGSTSAGWRVTRVVRTSSALGIARGTRYDYTCPDEAGNSSALRSVFGRYSTSTLTSVAARCTAPSVTVR